MQSLFFVKDLLTASASCLFVAAENALGQIKKCINTVAVVLEILINRIMQTIYPIWCKEYNNIHTHLHTHLIAFCLKLLSKVVFLQHIHLVDDTFGNIFFWHVLSRSGSFILLVFHLSLINNSTTARIFSTNILRSRTI